MTQQSVHIHALCLSAVDNLISQHLLHIPLTEESLIGQINTKTDKQPS